MTSLISRPVTRAICEFTPGTAVFWGELSSREKRVHSSSPCTPHPYDCSHVGAQELEN